METLLHFVRITLKFFFVLTPFFVLSMYLSMTSGLEVGRKISIAARVTFSVLIACLLLLLFGRWIFDVFGITVDAFRIGGGALLFLSAVALVNSSPNHSKQPDSSEDDSQDISVVPLAIPVTVGPATTAVLFVTGAENKCISDWIVSSVSITTACLILGLMLFFSSRMEQWIGRRGLTILSKLTGLILSALSAQMIFTGIKAFLR